MIVLLSRAKNNIGDFLLTDYEELDAKADIVIYLVAHKEFKGFDAKSIQLDFCGIERGK